MAEQANALSTMMIPVPRLVGSILGVVVTVLVSIGIYSWGTAPSYAPLYNGMEPSDASEVVTALQAAGIPHELNAASGSVMVESGRVHEARLKLASQGLPKGTALGVEMLQEEQSFGTSQFVESARYHHAIETELARTISTMRNVKSARVHLAIPKNSVFVRKRDNPSASVALNLYGGRTIEQGQVNAIIHMVASSVSNLATEKVTVVDQSGRLLSSGDMSSNVAMTAKQYDYSRKVEQDYQQRIERLLEPIIGMGKVRATVNVAIDFSQQETTEELFNNADQTVRSEQTSESSRFARETGGVPGALANQPPQGGQLVEGAGGVGDVEQEADPLNRSRNSVRNYEVDRTIRHSKQSSGSVERLNVAVLVDDQVVVEDGESTRTPLSAEEIARITTLVKQTVGYDEARGDQVEVINASFTLQEEIADLPEPSMMDNKYVQLALKWIWPFLLILVVIFTILKPSISSLTNYTPPPRQALSRREGDEEGGYDEGNTAADNVARLAHQAGPIPLPSGHDAKVDFAQSMVQQDAKKVANVVKDWIGSEAS